MLARWRSLLFLSFLNDDLTGKDGRQRRKATFTSGEADAHRPGQAPPGRPARPRHGPSHRHYPPHTRDVPAPVARVAVQAVSTMKDLALTTDSSLVAGVRCARSQCRCRVQTPIAVTGGCFK